MFLFGYDDPQTKISSIMDLHPSIPSNAMSLIFWNIPPGLSVFRRAFLVKRYRPNGVLKVVNNELSSSSFCEFCENSCQTRSCPPFRLECIWFHVCFKSVKVSLELSLVLLADIGPRVDDISALFVTPYERITTLFLLFLTGKQITEHEFHVPPKTLPPFR